jgi:hypothetical protein
MKDFLEKKKYILVLIILIILVLFMKFYFYKDSEWNFHNGGYDMNVVFYKNIFNEKRGSYCFYNNGKFNCPLYEKEDGIEWDKNVINIRQLNNNKFLIFSNREEISPAVVNINILDNITTWKIDKSKTKEYFDIPFDIKLYKVSYDE